jgi:hypothetical protein
MSEYPHDFIKVGELVCIHGKVFECSKCDERYDFAILITSEIYLQNMKFPTLVCRKCNQFVTIDNAFLRFRIPDPRTE